VENLGNLTPADLYFGRGPAILAEKEKIKAQTIQNRRLIHQRQAAQHQPIEPEPSRPKSRRLCQIIRRQTGWCERRPSSSRPPARADAASLLRRDGLKERIEISHGRAGRPGDGHSLTLRFCIIEGDAGLALQLEDGAFKTNGAERADLAQRHLPQLCFMKATMSRKRSVPQYA
jgi:hypothetical protein